MKIRYVKTMDIYFEYRYPQILEDNNLHNTYEKELL